MSDSSIGLTDTDPHVLKTQIELLRRAGPARSAAIALAMTTMAVKLSRAAIQRNHPDWSEQEVALMWAEVHYGKELTDRVREYLANHIGGSVASMSHGVARTTMDVDVIADLRTAAYFSAC